MKKQSAVPLEIERKFLIRYPDISLLESICSKKADILQIYLVHDGKISRRIRKMVCAGETQYWYNEKIKLSDTTRIEKERTVPEKEYKDLLEEADPAYRPIIKTRYWVPSGRHFFEIDIFPEWNDRAVAEVELEDENEEITFPGFLDLIREVTNDRRYTNVSLSRDGFVYDEI